VRSFLLLVLLGCTAPPARESLVLRIAVWGPLGELSPGENDGALASIARPWVFEKLATIDAAGAISPLLAARVERLPGSLVRIELRRDATFSDGTPVTGDDVVHSLEHSALRVTRSQGALVLESREPGMPVDALLLQVHIFRESKGKFIGSGPFQVASRTETELRLVRRTPQPGRINDVRLVAYPTTRDAFARTLKGDANAILDLESRWLEFFSGVPSLQLVRGGGHGTDAILFNARLARSERVELGKLLASRRVRELAYGGAECAEEGGADQDLSPPPGEPLGILSWGPFERLALAARRALGTRGGEVTQAQPSEVLARLKARDFDLVTVRPIRWPPSAIALVWRTGSPDNPSGYSNPAVDRAIAAGDWAAALASLRDDPPAALICTREQLAVVDARIRNPRLGPYDVLETLPDWEVAQ
jgi:hypothetical protein